MSLLCSRGVCLAVVLVVATMAAADRVSAQPRPAAAPAPAVDDPVVARIDSLEVRRSQVMAAHAALPQQYRSTPIATLYPVLLRQIIDSKLVAAQGRRENLHNDREVKQRIAQIEERILEETLVTREVGAKVTGDAVKARYAEFLKSGQKKEEVRARHILVETEDQAKGVIEELRKGLDFATVARNRSKDPGSVQRGGDLGFFGREDMVPEITEAAFALKPGEYSRAPIRTRFGFHVLKLEERRTPPPPSFDDAREELENQLSREVVESLLEGLRKTAKIERFNIDGSTIDEAPPPAIRRVQ